MLKKLSLLICVLYLFIFELDAQILIKGRIIDASTKQSLAFVSVQEDGTTNGVLSDIDGKFQLNLKNGSESKVITFSYLGYQKKEVLIKLIDPVNAIIELENAGFNLTEIVINPGVNPAIRIMKMVAKNADANNPQKMQSFTYNSYNKMFVTGDVNASEDSIAGFDAGNKTAMQKFFAKQHLFLTESVSKREFLYPSFNNETVLASRVSGFKAAPFTLLATQMQSFSFYDTWVNVFDINYLNPIDAMAIKKYSYTLEDTLYDAKDSIFIISFKPKTGKNFKALKGVLYINTNKYAVQNVIAEPAEGDQQISVKIQQKYEFINNEQWFPVQLNTDWIYNNIKLKDDKQDAGSSKMKAVSRSYVKEIVLNPTLSKKMFSEVELSIAKNADQKGDEFWDKYRVDTLSIKDKKTYKVVDSIGKRQNFDKKILGLEALFTGEVPISIFNVKLKEVFTFNAYEGYRVGIGLRTNNKLSSVFSVGGYGAYGFYDKAWKYGGNIDVRLWKKKELYFEGLAKRDVIETGSFSFYEKYSGLSNMELVRNLSINQMDKYTIQQVALSFRVFKYFKTFLFVNHQQRNSKYSYRNSDDINFAPIDTFDVTEGGVKLKFLFREKFMQTLRSKISLGSDYPVVYLNFIKGFKSTANSLRGEWNYTKLELKFNYSYRVSTIGKQNICIVASKIIGDVPYSLNYSALGNNYYKIAATTEHSFETMLPNEFINSQFASLFFSHNFGRFIKPNKSLNPELEFVHSMAIGTCNYTNRFYNVSYKTMEKGYWESGLKINCLIKSGFSGIGVGIFYRYGAYHLETPINNFAFKITMGFSLN